MLFKPAGKKNNNYKNTEIADTFLAEEKETYMRGFLLMNNEWILQSKQEMKDFLINGPNQKHYEFADNCFTKHIKAMRNFSCSGPSQRVSEIISRLPEFPKMKKMMDLGCTHGIDCIATVLKNPARRGVVFDKMPITNTTKEIIKDYGLEKRIDVLSGDYTVVSIGSSYDLVYAKATFNFFKDNLNPLFYKDL